eukprot:scaffold201957_cov30-Prasinocladus_malaysianus.AAC.1
MAFLSGGLTARDAILLKPHTCDDLFAARLVFLADLCVNLQAAFEVCHGLAGVVAATGGMDVLECNLHLVEPTVSGRPKRFQAQEFHKIAWLHRNSKNFGDYRSRTVTVDLVFSSSKSQNHRQKISKYSKKWCLNSVKTEIFLLIGLSRDFAIDGVV